MAGEKTCAPHAQDHSSREAALAGAVALANLFGSCVEAFQVVHSVHRWDRAEQLLMCKLGLQQARLLIWGDVVGVSSPPASVTDRAVPKHPSSAYPDLTEPTFFGPRDRRLDDPEIRTLIDNALSSILERSTAATREEMMEKYGLKAPKSFDMAHEPALDINRLEAFRERHELLMEVAESYAQISAPRNPSLIQTSWTITDPEKFEGFIKITKEKIDVLINLMKVKDRVDRAMKMDIKALGWHLAADRARVAIDTSKLRFIQESCAVEYPEYTPAVQVALANIDREKRERTANYNPYVTGPIAVPVKVPKTSKASSTRKEGDSNGEAEHGANSKRSSLLGGLLKSLGRKSNSNNSTKGRSLSVGEAPARSMSDAGPTRTENEDENEPTDAALETVRSKSVGAILDIPSPTFHEQIVQSKLQRVDTNATADSVLEHGSPVTSMISRHDQYHGLGRQGTKNQ